MRQRQCRYAGCTTTFTIGYQGGARRYCPAHSQMARQERLQRYEAERKASLKGYWVWPPRECQNARCKTMYTPTGARQLYCCERCALVGQRVKRLRRIMELAS